MIWYELKIYYRILNVASNRNSKIVEMKVLEVNTFLYFGDKNVSKVSGVWKALHISIYVAIAINSFITSMAVGNMFQTFKYNCILFCNKVEFEREILPTGYFEHIKSVVVENSLITEETTENSTGVVNGTDEYISENMFVNITALKNSTDDIPNYNANIVKKNNNNAETTSHENLTIIFKNQTHIFQNEDGTIVIVHGKIDIRKTRFTSSFWCNFVLGIALITFIFTTFCGVILAMCSKGGKGRENTLNRPQNMLYPILVSSLLLGILNFATCLIVKSGLRDFCANFELFTEDKRCSPMINQFTIHERQERFYLPYLVLSYSFSLTIILFVCQVLVTLLRIMYAVDYQLYALSIEENEEENEFDIEDGHIKEITL